MGTQIRGHQILLGILRLICPVLPQPNQDSQPWRRRPAGLWTKPQKVRRPECQPQLGLSLPEPVTSRAPQPQDEALSPTSLRVATSLTLCHPGRPERGPTLALGAGEWTELEGRRAWPCRVEAGHAGRGAVAGVRGGVAAGEQGDPIHLEDLGHVFRVPLLCDIAQLGRDIDPATDVHVHLHGLFLDLCVQVCHGLQGGQQGVP